MGQQNSKNVLTLANAESLLGKTLTGTDKNGRRFPFHYYPLIVRQLRDGSYAYEDRNHTMVLLDNADEIPFGEVMESCK